MINHLYLRGHEEVKLEEVFFERRLEEEVQQFVKEFKHNEVLSHFGLPVNNKLLLHGKTGCGKTMTAKALAHSLGKALIVVNLGSLVSSKLGETSKNITALFKKAEREKSILFFDEFDSVGKIRDYDSKDSSEMKRVVNTLLQLIDYLPKDTLLLAATNQIHMLDEAVIRRFDLKLKFNAPAKALLDNYYDALLQTMPEGYRSIDRHYDISFAEAKTACMNQVKKALVNDLETGKVMAEQLLEAESFHSC